MIINVDPRFARKMFPRFTENCAVACVKELLRIHFEKKAKAKAVGGTK